MIDFILKKIFPESIYCILCGSIIDNTRSYSLCDSCIEKFLWVDSKTCKMCGKLLKESYQKELCPDCIDVEHHFDKGFTCASYGLYERTLISQFKKRDKAYIARIIGEILHDRIVIEKLPLDVIIPIPMHHKKKRKRGFNQSELMAKFLANRMELPYKSKIIERKKETLPMKKLGLWERRENMRDAFIIDIRYKSYLTGKNVLLIDDIYTTGATMDECSKALKKEGAKKVYILTFAAGNN